MRISVWQQFSSNNSSDFTVVGVFDTPEAAQRAATEVRQMIETIKAWWEQHPDDWDKYNWSDETSTPPEVEIGERFGFLWPGAIEWYHSAAIKVVLDRFVYITTEGFRPDTVGEPFDKVLTGLGGQGLLHGNSYGDQIGTILAEINCIAPDEAIAQEIIEKYLSWDQYGKSDGRQVHLYDWTFSEFDLPELVEYLSNKGCTDIQYRLYQSQKPNGKTPTAKDVEVLIRVLDSGKAWDIDKIADVLAEIGDTRAVEPLIRALDRADALDRLAIASALGDLRDARAVDALIALLNDVGVLSPAPIAARALAKIGAPRAIQRLIQFLNNDEHWHIAAESLTVFGQSAQDALLQAMDDSGPPLEARIMHALALIKAANEFAPEFLTLRDSDPDKQKQAFEAVKRSPRARDLLIAILQNPPESHMRIEAANALAEIGDTRAIEQIEEHLRYLGREGVTALEKFGAPAVDALMRMVRSPESWIRETAAQSLLRLADPRSTATLIAVLPDAEWYSVLRSVVQRLVLVNDVGLIPPLVKLFIESSARWHPESDAQIIEALKKLDGTAELLTRLLSELVQDSESSVAMRNIRALGTLGDKRAIGPLMALLDHPSHNTRYSAKEALHKLDYSDEASH